MLEHQSTSRIHGEVVLDASPERNCPPVQLQTAKGQTVRMDQEKGWILDGETRLGLFDVRTLHAFTDRLILTAGHIVAKTLLYQLGRAIGEQNYNQSKALIHSEKDWQKVYDSALQFLGWGRCSDIALRNETEKTVYVFTLRNTLESHERRAAEPICHLQRGAVAGWLEAYLGKKALNCAETQCACQGAQQCVFEVTFASPTSSDKSEVATAK